MMAQKSNRPNTINFNRINGIKEDRKTEVIA